MPVNKAIRIRHIFFRLLIRFESLKTFNVIKFCIDLTAIRINFDQFCVLQFLKSCI